MPANRSALIIANDAFEDAGLRELRAPAQDAKQLERVLSNPMIGDFDVRPLVNQPAHNINRRIEEFFSDRGREDLLLLYVSSHGMKDDDGRLYFAAADTRLSLLGSTAVFSRFIEEQMERCRSRKIVLVLDCCYSGAFTRGLAPRGDERMALKERFEGRGRIVLTASSSMEYSFEDRELVGRAGRPSVFTRTFVRGLETGEADFNGDGYISVDELYDYIYERVREETPKQTPVKWAFDVQGEIYIARSPRRDSLKPAGVPLDLKRAIESPLAEARHGAVAALTKLLEGTDPVLADAAEQELRKLTDDDSRVVSDAAIKALAASRAPAPGSPPEPDAPARAPRFLAALSQLWGRPGVRVGMAALVVIAVTASLISILSPNPRVLPPPAARLRSELNNILTEHLHLEALAAAAELRDDTESSEAWSGALEGNSATLAHVVSSAYGKSVTGELDRAWKSHIASMLSYARGVRAEDAEAQEKAMADLRTSSRELGSFMQSESGISGEKFTGLVSRHTATLRGVIDAQRAKNATGRFSALRQAHAHMDRISEPMAEAIARTLKLPGGAASPASDLLASLNALLREHVWLEASAASAVMQGDEATARAAAEALNGEGSSNSTDLINAVGAVYGEGMKNAFGPEWRKHVGLVLRYASELTPKDAAGLVRALGARAWGLEDAPDDLKAHSREFGALMERLSGLPRGKGADLMLEHMLMTLRVAIDDAVSKKPAEVALDLRKAVTHMDSLAETAVRRFPAKFES
ncbi:MAG: caspase family protein [Actinomycetota bacterium]